MKKTIFAICLLIGGCSTITNGPTQEIAVTSDPPGAIITTTNFEWIKTPGILNLPRKNSTILTANLFGYKTAKKELKCSFNPLIAGDAVGQYYPRSFLLQPDGGVALFMLDMMASDGAIGLLSPTRVHFDLVPKKPYHPPTLEEVRQKMMQL